MDVANHDFPLAGSLHGVGFFPNNIATVVSLMAVALPFGGTLALTIMSTVFNNTSGIGSSSPLRDLSTLQQLPPAILEEIVNKARVHPPTLALMFWTEG